MNEKDMKKLKRFTNELIKTYNLNPEFVDTDLGNAWEYGDIKGKNEFGSPVYNLEICITLDTDVDSVNDCYLSIRTETFEISTQFFDFESLKFTVNAILRELDVIE